MAKFSLGKTVATPRALEALAKSGQEPSFFLNRHVNGDWGDDLSDGDREANDEALVNGDRILSSFKTLRGVKVWVVTEGVGNDGKRAATTLLLPDEY